MRCRVCARYTGHAQVTLNGVTLTTSAAGNFDSTLVCHDYSYLPSGLLPISVQYASDPTDVNNAFQFWIIPVKSVTEVANPVPSRLPSTAYSADRNLEECSAHRYALLAAASALLPLCSTCSAHPGASHCTLGLP